MKKILAFLTAASVALMCGCSKKGDSSSDPLKEISDNARNENFTSDDFKVFPQGVDLTDSKRTFILTPDLDDGDDSNDNYIDYKDPSGSFKFALPEGVEQAYHFTFKEIDTYETENPTARSSVYVLNPFFPQSKEYVRISTETAIQPFCEDYEWYLNTVENSPVKSVKERSSYDDYIDTAKADIAANKLLFEYYEKLDRYNFIDVSPSASDFVFMPEMKMIDMSCFGVVTISYQNYIYAYEAPDSSISSIESEPFELKNGNIGLKLTYELTRLGVTVEREVYWLFAPDTDHMVRVEFNKDKNAQSYIDVQKFLENTEIYVNMPEDPAFENGGK